MSSSSDTHPYKVINDKGEYVLQATADCPHEPEVELLLLLSHHQIINNSVELTIESVEAKIGDKKRIAEIRQRHAMLR